MNFNYQETFFQDMEKMKKNVEYLKSQEGNLIKELDNQKKVAK